MAEKSRLACDPAQTRGRMFPEERDANGRSPFERDCDRIIYSKALRKMESKTQVFLSEGDMFRKRLTHSHEVARIARALCKNLGLDEDLAEVISLAHDIGHTPFGHAGEEALQELYPDFDHNSQGLRIVTKLERKYASHEGLNLTWETLEGLAKHNGPVANPSRALIEVNNAFREARGFDLELEKHSSLEAQLAAMADDIAYISHDIEDGLRAGLFVLDDLLDLPIVGEKIKEARARFPNEDDDIIVSEMISPVMVVLINDLLGQTNKTIAETGVQSSDDVRNLGKQIATFSSEVDASKAQIKEWLMQHMYKHKLVMADMDKGGQIIMDLFKYYKNAPNNLPDDWRVNAQNNNLDQVIADYIAGMTDRYAMLEHEKLV